VFKILRAEFLAPAIKRFLVDATRIAKLREGLHLGE
jgi:hypothetical protein